MTSNGGGPTRQTSARQTSALQASARREFADRLDRLGPAVEGWPADERAAAELLLAEDGAARAMRAAARSVEDALGLLMRTDAAPLRRRTAAPPLVASWRRLAGFGMAALAASLVIGFAVGAVLPTADDDDGTAAVYMAVNDTDLGGVL